MRCKLSKDLHAYFTMLCELSLTCAVFLHNNWGGQYNTVQRWGGAVLNKRKGTVCRDYAEKIVKGYLLCIHGAVLQRFAKSRGTPGKRVYVKSVSRVRISVTPLMGRSLRGFCPLFLYTVQHYA